MESTAQDDSFSLESMAVHGIKVTVETVYPHLMQIQEQMNPRLKRFLNWENVASTGLMFTTVISTLVLLHYFTVIKMVSFALLALLMISIILWIPYVYKKYVLAYKSDDSKCLKHPFKPYFEMKIDISETEIHRVADEAIKFIDIISKRSKEIIFVDNLWDSAVAWCIGMTVSIYCGTSMTALTLLKLIVVCLFIVSLPFGYIEHKATVDEYCIDAFNRIQHGKRINCNNHEDTSTMEKDHKGSLSESLITKFSLVMFLVHRELKMIYYLLTPLVISVFTTLLLNLWEVEIPHIEFLTGKRSYFNQIFVKFGWGWTLSLLLLFQLCFIFIYSQRWLYLRNIAIKTFFTTLFFYVWCQIIFPLVEEFNGECKYNGNIIDISKRQCIKSPEHAYKSYFDISGHAYLMSYCVLILMHEAHQVEDLLKALRHPGKYENLVPCAPQFAAFLVAISFILITILTLLWDFMIIVTMIYFHTFTEIILGVILAILMYLIIYEKILPYFLSNLNITEV
ncbi:unnamed protein product [Meganyctiphanes norvegica]|uniref:Reticulon-like protein n=1 Tax=Meganyctiphanes norvegica TaxID=48144 RepID=A0AAV2SAQ3_MEGNR